MSYNLAQSTQSEKDRLNSDLAAASVAFKERYKMPVNVSQVEKEQPEALRAWFRERLAHHRQHSQTLSRLAWEPRQK